MKWRVQDFQEYAEWARARVKAKVLLTWEMLHKENPPAIPRLDLLTASADWQQHEAAMREAIDNRNEHQLTVRVERYEDWTAQQLRSFWPKKKGEQS